MNLDDAVAILPLLILAATPLVVMCGIAVRRSHVFTAAVSLLGLAAAFVSVWAIASFASRRVTPLLIVDPYALFYIGLIAAATFAVVLLCYAYFENLPERKEELYIFVLIAALGSAVLAASRHFVSFFLGLELLSVSLYAMVAYPHWRSRSVEAALKYLILAAASAAFLLFGMALIYGELGTMDFDAMAGAFTAGASPNPAVLIPALALLVTGIGFKLAVVPFHMWTPMCTKAPPLRSPHSSPPYRRELCSRSCSGTSMIRVRARTVPSG
jgi:NADH-quinone oxidoreductase subunit N